MIPMGRSIYVSFTRVSEEKDERREIIKEAVE